MTFLKLNVCSFFFLLLLLAGFEHAHNLNIDFSVIRLCFQTFIQDSQGQYRIPLNAVVSQPIIDKSKWVRLILSLLQFLFYFLPVAMFGHCLEFFT